MPSGHLQIVALVCAVPFLLATVVSVAVGQTNLQMLGCDALLLACLQSDVYVWPILRLPTVELDDDDRYALNSYEV